MGFKLFRLLMAPEPEDGGGGGGAVDIHIGGEGGPIAQLPEGSTDAVRAAVNGPLKNFFDNEGKINTANVLESYINVQKVMGQDKVLAPREDWGDDQWTSFYKGIGQVEKIEDYVIKNNVPEGLTANDEMFSELMKVAHTNGVLPHQFQKISDKFNEMTKTHIDTTKTNGDTAFATEVNKLKEEWGQGYENTLNVIDSTLVKFSSEDELAELKKFGLDKDPIIQRLLKRVADGLLSEDDPLFKQAQTKTFGKTPEQAQASLSEHMAKPEKATRHPGHAVWQSQYIEILESIHGKSAANGGVSPGGNIATMR